MLDDTQHSDPNVENEGAVELQWESENDPDNPFNWPVRTKWSVTLIACYVTFIVGLNAASITSAANQINGDFHISDEHFPNSFWPVTSWAVGAAVTPMVVLPMMEDMGMRPGYLISYALFTVFVIPQAVAQNFATLIVTRFFAGCAGGVLQDSTDGVIADVWAGPVARSLPIACYVFCLISGVTTGSVIGGGIIASLSWRWIFYIQLIIYGSSLPLIWLLFKETRGPVILLKRAQRASTPLKDLANSTASSRKSPSTSNLRTFLRDNILLPTRLLVTEPVVFFFTLLTSLSYGLVFLSTQSIPLVYPPLYHFSTPATSLIQTALLVGEIIGFLSCLWQNHIFHHAFSRSQTATHPNPNLSEVRLYLAIPASLLGLTGGLFIYAFTATRSTHWLVPSLGLALTGYGSVAVMTAVMTYLTDAYAKYAASASAAACFGENVVAAFLPLAANRMYATLGVRWAGAVLGFVALGLTVAPVVLVWKGEGIRRRSRFMVVAAY